MNQATNVNIVPSYGQRGDLHFSQYDVGRTATINLYAVNEAYTIPVGATVKIQATKPSGLGFDVACTFSGSVVTVVSTETMTAEAGRFPCELRITKDSDVIGTANFMFVVEASPHPDGVIDGDADEVINEIKALVLQSEGYALGTQDGVPVDEDSPYYHNNSKYFSENTSLPVEFRQALLNCFSKVAWIDADGQNYYNALANSLNPEVVLVSISAVYTQSGKVYDFDSLSSLEDDLVVTATYDDSSTATITGYELSGTLDSATSTITVTYSGKTDTFDVSVTLPVFSYNSATDGKLSEMDGITTYVSNASDFSEAVTESGNLELKGTNSSNSAYWQFRFDDFTTGNKSILRVRANIYSLPTATPSSGTFGLRMRLSDGSVGINCGQAKDSSAMNFNCYVGSTGTTITSSITYGSLAWHDFELRLDKTAPSQKIYVDGEEVFSSSTLSSTSTTNNSVFVIANPTIYMKTIDLYNAE